MKATGAETQAGSVKLVKDRCVRYLTIHNRTFKFITTNETLSQCLLKTQIKTVSLFARKPNIMQ